MTRTAAIALTAGVSFFIALLAWQGFGAVVSALYVAGWGLLLVAAFHLLPVVLDAAAIHVLADTTRGRLHSMRDALLARWVGESVNSLLPAGQIGGPVLMVRHLAQLGTHSADAAAIITVSTTMQTLAQVVFACLGVAVFGAYQAAHPDGRNLLVGLIAMIAVCAALLGVFYAAQRRGLFGRVARLFSRLVAGRDWSSLLARADAADAAVHALHGERRRVAWSFALSLAGWIVGTGEVWLALQLIGHPVGWVDALLLESLGQAIRGAAFAIPGALGVQEGGYLLLAPLVGLPADAALALSLAKRAREILLGLPGLVYLHVAERGWRRSASRLAVDRRCG